MRTPHLLLLAMTMLLLAAIPASADSILVDNGAIDGNTNAYSINYGYSVSNSFDLSTTQMITGLVFGSWLLSTDLPQTIDWQITANDPFTGNIVAGGSTADLTSTFQFTNSYGFDIYSSLFPIMNVSLPAGDYWFQLGNGVTSLGLPMFWDQSNGPASASQFDGVNISPLAYTDPLSSQGFSGSESFQILTPEPGTMALLGSGLVLAGFLRRKKSR